MIRRLDRYEAIVASASIAAFAVLVWLGRGLTFFADEWEVIENRPIGIETFFRPFNEHWLGVTTLVHRAMVEAVGLGTYVPYLALLAALHVLVAVLIFALLRRRTHAGIATGIAIVFLFFGSGFENLFWGMQIGFVGAIAFGLVAMLLLDGKPTGQRTLLAGTLLLIAVATSGYGLFMLGLVGLDVFLDRRRWRALPAVVVPGAVWLGWYVLVGRTGIATHGDPFTLDQVLAVPGFVLRGGGAAFGGATGVGPLLGIGVLVGVVGWLAVRARRGYPITPRTFAALGALVGMYGLLALVRSQLDDIDATQYTRYTYLSAIFAFIVIAELVGRPALPSFGRARLAIVASAASVFVLSLAFNAALLVAGRGLFAERADLTRAFIELGLSRPLPDGVDERLSLVLVPSPKALAAIVARHGSPLEDILAADAVAPITDDARREASQRARNPPVWLVSR